MENNHQQHVVNVELTDEQLAQLATDAEYANATLGTILAISDNVIVLDPASEDHRFTRTVSNALRSYTGNDIHTFVVVIGRESQLQHIVMESAKIFLRRHSFGQQGDLEVVPAMEIQRSPTIDQNDLTQEHIVQAAVDQLLDALSENEIANTVGIQIDVPVTPNPPTLQRFIRGAACCQAPTSKQMTHTTSLLINRGENDDIDMNFNILLNEDDENLRVQLLNVSATGINEMDHLFHGVMTLPVRFRILTISANQRSLERLATHLLPSHHYSAEISILHITTLVGDEDNAPDQLIITAPMYMNLIRIQGLHGLRFMHCSFVEDTQANGMGVDSFVDDIRPLEDLHLDECTLGRAAANVLGLHPSENLHINSPPTPSSPTGSSLHHDDDMIEEFVSHLCSRHGSTLSALAFSGSHISAREMNSLCRLLGSENCHIRMLHLGGATQENDLTDECVAIFFDHLSTFHSLLFLYFEHRVTTLELSGRILAGVQSNVSLDTFDDFEFDIQGGHEYSRAISFWIRSNKKGRALLERHLRREVPPGLLTHVFHHCSVTASAPATAEQDVPVLYHFVRQVLPNLLDRPGGVNSRGTQRPRHEPADNIDNV